MAGSGKSKLCCAGSKVIPRADCTGNLPIPPESGLHFQVRGLSRWSGMPHDPYLWLELVGAKKVRLEALV